MWLQSKTIKKNMGKQRVNQGDDKMKKLVKTLRDRMIENFEVMSGLK